MKNDLKLIEHHIVGGNMGGIVVLKSKRIDGEGSHNIPPYKAGGLSGNVYLEEWNIWATKQQEIII